MCKKISALMALLLLLLVSACGSSPQLRYYTLEDGVPTAVQGTSPSILVLSASVPEVLDRPQIVLRGAAQQLVLSEQQRWAESLRSSIPRALAADLQRLLNSSRIAALPAGAPFFDADFRLSLHVQSLDARLGQGVDLDLVWVLKPRQGKEILGRSQIFEAQNGEGGVPMLVGAQRRALARAASEIAAEIRRHGD